MRKGLRNKNQGYSMIEMIIVIAIIGILSVMSLITWRAVDSAANKKAVSTFESELSTLRTTTMAQDSTLAMRLYYDTTLESYCLERGIIYMGVFVVPDPSDPVASLDYFSYKGTSNPVMVMKKGSITYDGQDVKDIADGVYIHFNKSDGSIDTAYGAATKYIFRDKSGDLIANVKLNKDTGLYKETYEN